MQEEEIVENSSPVQAEDAVGEIQAVMETELPGSVSSTSKETESAEEHFTDDLLAVPPPDEASDMVSEPVSHENDTIVRGVELYQQASDYEPDVKGQRVSPGISASDIADSVVELESWQAGKVASWHNLEGHSIQWLCVLCIDRKGLMADITIALATVGFAICSCVVSS